MEPSWIAVAGAALVPLGLVVAYLRARRRRAAQVAPPAAPPVDRLRQGLLSTRRRLAAELEAALGRGATEPERALKGLEEALVAADVGVRTSAELVARVRTRVGRTASGAEIRQALQEEVEAVLGVVAEPTPTACPWVVLVDTAGRLHTRTNLMEELRKTQRVIAREVPGAPHETLLVLDATTGQNAIAQARTFSEALGVTGIILTKLDGTARGGVAIAIREQTGLPIRYLGVGEGTEDLRPFEAHQFARALLEPDVPAAERARFA